MDNNSVRPRINVTVSILSLLTIIGVVRFAVAHERRRLSEYLQSMYQELNKQFFDNALPTTRIEWSDLTDKHYIGETYQESDGSFVILVDRATNLFDSDLSDTVAHETCHTVTWRREEDPHGPLFQACMASIKANKY